MTALLAGGGCLSAPYAPLRTGTVATKVPPEVEYRNGSFEGARKTRLYEQSWRPTREPRAVVVLVHGFKDHGSRYKDAAVSLAQWGIAVHALDLRGHGYSEGIREHVDAFADYLKDLDLLLAAVRGREAGKPLFLVGHGLGGTIAALYVIRHKPPLAGLVLSAPVLRASSGFGNKMASVFAPRSPSIEHDLSRRSSDRLVVEDLRRDPLVYAGDGTARTARELALATAEIEARRGEIAVPLLVLQGSGDRVIDLAAAHDLHRHARSVPKAMNVYPGLQHDLFHEPQRDQVIEDLGRWVRDNAHAPAPAVSPTPSAPPASPPRKSGRRAAGATRG